MTITPNLWIYGGRYPWAIIPTLSTPKVTALPYHVQMVTQSHGVVKAKLDFPPRKVADVLHPLVGLAVDDAMRSRLRSMLDGNAMPRGTSHPMLDDDSILDGDQPLAMLTPDLCTHVSAPCLVVSDLQQSIAYHSMAGLSTDIFQISLPHFVMTMYFPMKPQKIAHPQCP
jgi:hypothetical protein